AEVVDGMYGVVNEGGTGHAAALPNIEVCGKTGTAQLVSTEKMKSMHLKNNAWFDRDVMKAYFDKKARLAKERTQLTREFHTLTLPWAMPMPAALALGSGLN